MNDKPINEMNSRPGDVTLRGGHVISEAMNRAAGRYRELSIKAAQRIPEGVVAMRNVVKVVGLDGRAVCHLMAADGMAVALIAERRRETEAQTLAILREGLGKLARHWRL